MNRLTSRCTACLLGSCALLLAGCSSITAKHYVTGQAVPICDDPKVSSPVAVYWGAAWRDDQKDEAVREGMLAEGIAAFFMQLDCVQLNHLATEVGGIEVLMASERELTTDASRFKARRAYVIRVEEFGPNLELNLSPTLWRTRNEVLLRVKVLDVEREAVVSDVTVHWNRAGAYAFLSAEQLPHDLAAALATAFADSGG